MAAKEELQAWLTEEDGIGVIEVVLSRSGKSLCEMGRIQYTRQGGGECMAAKEELQAWLTEEDGIGVIEVVLILVGILTPYH